MDPPKPEGWPWFRVVEEERFKEEIRREFGGDIRVWDDVRKLAEEDILRGPGEFPFIPGTDYHFARLAVVPPRILVFRVDMENKIIYYKAVRRTGQG